MPLDGRLAIARQALMQAEVAVGLNAVSFHQEEEPAWAGLDGWDVPAGLESVFPSGLRHGMTLGVHGSRAASLLTAGIASSQGAWVACLGMPDMNWGLAGLLGLDIEHTVFVRECPPSMLSQAVSAAIDGFDVVLVGQSLLDQRDKRLLSRRALSRKILLIGEGWDERESVEAQIDHMSGIHRGSGHISSLALSLRRRGAVNQSPALVEITGSGWHMAEACEQRSPVTALRSVRGARSHLKVVGA